MTSISTQLALLLGCKVRSIRAVGFYRRHSYEAFWAAYSHMRTALRAFLPIEEMLARELLWRNVCAVWNGNGNNIELPQHQPQPVRFKLQMHHTCITHGKRATGLARLQKLRNKLVIERQCHPQKPIAPILRGERKSIYTPSKNVDLLIAASEKLARLERAKKGVAV